MPPRLVPAEPKFPTDSERAVWARLHDALRPQDTLIANYRLTDSTKDHEADLVVVMPDVGVLIVEVIGAGLSVREGRWYMWRNGRDEPIDPVGQARETRYAIQRYVESDPRWAQSSRGRIRYAHSVVAPFTTLGDDFDLPG